MKLRRRKPVPEEVGGHRGWARQHLQVCVCAQRLQGGELCLAAGDWVDVRAFDSEHRAGVRQAVHAWLRRSGAGRGLPVGLGSSYTPRSLRVQD